MKKSTKNKATRAFLQAYGYTPATLAIDLGIGKTRANRILNDDDYLTFDDMQRIRMMFGLYFGAIFEETPPGEVRRKMAQLEEHRRGLVADIKDVTKTYGNNLLKNEQVEELDDENISITSLYNEKAADVSILEESR